MKDPFKIEGPALISFSGGRTSGYMLYQIVQAWGGALPDDIKVTFANTGKEMPQTLDFVEECGEQFGVEIVWLERTSAKDDHGTRFRIVDRATAAAAGEPFKQLIRDRQYLPNPVARFCTVELKIRVMRDYARSLGWKNWTNVIGLRADERHRVAKAQNNSDAWENSMPLYTAGITKEAVAAFWIGDGRNWGLRLPSVNGTTPMGNCDLCFLKSASTLQGIMRARPDLAKWWIEAEAEAEALASKPLGAVFRKDRPSYAAMFDAVQRQQVIDFGDADQREDCYCTGDS